MSSKIEHVCIRGGGRIGIRLLEDNMRRQLMAESHQNVLRFLPKEKIEKAAEANNIGDRQDT